MTDVYYIDRKSGKREKEAVYGHFYLKLLYKYCPFLQKFFVKSPLMSRFYGWLQKRSSSAKKVAPFVKKYGVDMSEALKSTNEFSSFNDFFIRQIKPRNMQGSLVMPADGRYLVFDDVSTCDGLFVKGKIFSLERLLGSKELADRYAKGALVMARLCPVDYHRFHVPCTCTPTIPKLINGALYSVNPIALKENIEIFCENKRVMTELYSHEYGRILYIEIGATNVGSIVQTFTPNKEMQAGDEKGYFEFGGSSLILLFEPNKVCFDQDLIDASKEHIEVRGSMGDSLGSKLGTQENRDPLPGKTDVQNK